MDRNRAAGMNLAHLLQLKQPLTVKSLGRGSRDRRVQAAESSEGAVVPPHKAAYSKGGPPGGSQCPAPP